MKKLTKKEVDELKLYVPIEEIQEEKISVTDLAEDYKQYCLKLSDDSYVYAVHSFKDGEIQSEKIDYSDLTADQIEEASDTFDFKGTRYSEAQKKQLAIELYFELCC